MNVIEVRSPTTGDSIGQVAVAEDGQTEAQALEAREAQRAWAARAFAERQEVLVRFHDLVLDRDVEILDTIQAETGKSRRDAFTEILGVAGTARYYAYSGKHHLRPHKHRSAVPVLTGARTHWVPHALVGFITPWNYPFLLAVADALPALLGGSAVLLKPSERTPLSAQLGRSLLIEAGLDPRLFVLINGFVSQAEHLIDAVDYVAFTGGAEAGRAVAGRAANRLIDYSLELGGKNPMIIADGARIDDVVEGLVAGAYVNSGQACISVERVYVTEGLYDLFLEAAARRISAMRLGASDEWSVDMGSLISPDHADSVVGHVDTAVEAGARVVAGGKRRPDLGPAFVEPTLLTHVTSGSPVATSETFGPVVSVYPVRDTADAIARANSSPFGLNASVWGREGPAIATKLAAGSTGIHSSLQIYGSFDVPMGGIKGSGIGKRHGADGLRRFGTTRAIVSGPARWGGYDSLWSRLKTARSASQMKFLYRLWRRLPGIR